MSHKYSDEFATHEKTMVVQEVVSLGRKVAAGPQQLQKQTGIHLSPQQWHAHLQRVSQGTEDALVLLDARNIYETRIGHFSSVSAPTMVLLENCFNCVLYSQLGRIYDGVYKGLSTH